MLHTGKKKINKLITEKDVDDIRGALKNIDNITGVNEIEINPGLIFPYPGFIAETNSKFIIKAYLFYDFRVGCSNFVLEFFCEDDENICIYRRVKENLSLNKFLDFIKEIDIELGRIHSEIKPSNIMDVLYKYHKGE
ncbi:hypothetical protein [uncultured Paraglaciecola sp.]|uniref:hypothetical protein n=1 Tax=uncultured Paraglaciecola sp. TaxID=1765024 RepID=UPI00261CD5AF|nr:hypothetical protein [uncultured Paraglaciecola sp.]